MPILNQVERQRRAPLGVLDDEFFVEDNELTILDPDFWTDGYALRDGSDEVNGSKCVPMFLGHIAPFILGAGKSIGLLRALGITIAVEDEADSQAHCLTFSDLVTELSSDGRIRIFSVDDLSRLVYDSLLPRCQIVQSQLAQVVIEDCQLWTHLAAIEDVYLMRRGDVMSRICDAIFAKIRRAKSVLERILVRGPAKGARAGNDLKMLYALRSRLSWFMTALLDFITTYVIHTQLLKFHKALKDAKSLDEIIELHQDHLNTLEDRCLLQSNTSSLRRAVVSILDMALYFNNCFVAFAGDTTLDISRHSLTGLKKHRSRRLQRQRRNAIGFVQSLRERDSDSSDSDSDADLEGDAPAVIDVLTVSQASFEEEGFGRIDKMSEELDGLVRFVRRAVEGLAGGASEAASAFGIFAFTLEDWDK
ncbi:hypothetical protein EWM64_g4587 [Hericium alpestre]|uniref:Spindle pole body component n=1 Tax=Hericium alpestre TaxID=135208 RepID=A0A4Y9ZX18_9AGAM|nr:hypothetical protein EWM64_g4587 [Hericium alpestre]